MARPGLLLNPCNNGKVCSLFQNPDTPLNYLPSMADQYCRADTNRIAWQLFDLISNYGIYQKQIRTILS